MKRHKSVGKFVQKSQTKAEIKITICNNDNEPFKRDVYGDYIIFDRHLYASGLSIYNIKNESSIVKSIWCFLVNKNIRVEFDASAAGK